MIEINLLPQDMRKKEPRFKPIELDQLDLKNMPVKNIAIAVAAVLLAIHIALFAIGSYSKSIARDFSKKYNALLPEKKEAINLRAQIDLINRKVAAIDELMIRRFSWSKKLNDLSDSVTPGIWLSSLEYEEKLGERVVQSHKQASSKTKTQSSRPSTEKVALRYLIISGYASSMGEQGTALVGKFIQSLKDSAGFYSDIADIELGSIRSEKMQDQEVMSFKLTCMFKQAE